AEAAHRTALAVLDEADRQAREAGLRSAEDLGRERGADQEQTRREQAALANWERRIADLSDHLDQARIRRAEALGRMWSGLHELNVALTDAVTRRGVAAQEARRAPAGPGPAK